MKTIVINGKLHRKLKTTERRQEGDVYENGVYIKSLFYGLMECASPLQGYRRVKGNKEK